MKHGIIALMIILSLFNIVYIASASSITPIFVYNTFWRDYSDKYPYYILADTNVSTVMLNRWIRRIYADVTQYDTDFSIWGRINNTAVIIISSIKINATHHDILVYIDDDVNGVKTVLFGYYNETIDVYLTASGVRVYSDGNVTIRLDNMTTIVLPYHIDYYIIHHVINATVYTGGSLGEPYITLSYTNPQLYYDNIVVILRDQNSTIRAYIVVDFKNIGQLEIRKADDSIAFYNTYNIDNATVFNLINVIMDPTLGHGYCVFSYEGTTGSGEFYMSFSIPANITLNVETLTYGRAFTTNPYPIPSAELPTNDFYNKYSKLPPFGDVKGWMDYLWNIFSDTWSMVIKGFEAFGTMMSLTISILPLFYNILKVLPYLFLFAIIGIAVYNPVKLFSAIKSMYEFTLSLLKALFKIVEKIMSAIMRFIEAINPFG